MKKKFIFFPITFFLISAIVLPTNFTGLSSGLGTHSLAGGTLGYTIAETDFQAFILGFLSHALLDLMPHHDPNQNDPVELSFYSLFNLGGLWTSKEIYEETGGDSRFLWGAIGGILPDLEHIFYSDNCVGGNCPNKIYPAHNGTIPHHGDAPAFQGYLTETTVIGMCLTIYF